MSVFDFAHGLRLAQLVTKGIAHVALMRCKCAPMLQLLVPNITCGSTVKNS